MKKGFTLIELIAVVLILGIVALIAIPVASNVIEDAKKNTAKDSALNYIKAIDNQNALALLQPNKYNYVSSGDVEDINVNIKGEKPTSGSVVMENGKVKTAVFIINDYEVVYQNNNATVGKKDVGEPIKMMYFAPKPTPEKQNETPEEPEPTIEEQESTPEEPEIVPEPIFGGVYESIDNKTYKGIVYVDPTDYEKICLIHETEGCLKFYVYDENEENYIMILDHNIENSVAYSLTGNNSSMTINLDQLAPDWFVSPRLITTEEIAKLTGASTKIKWKQKNKYVSSLSSSASLTDQSSWYYLDGTGTTYSTKSGWQKQVAKKKGASKYAWLYDNTNGCESKGCNFNDASGLNGYWTQDKITGSTTNAWCVTKDGRIYSVSSSSTSYGIRPVIELSKLLFETK